MKRLNRKLEYSLMALKHMLGKRPGELTSANEIVETVGCPFDATARVLQIMAQNGLLKSEQGVHGGYVIVRDLSKVSFYELSEMILGPARVTKCLEKEDCELHQKCNIHTPMQMLDRKVNDFYRSLSLGEILRVRDL
jgi:Rrf2 family protein